MQSKSSVSVISDDCLVQVEGGVIFGINEAIALSAFLFYVGVEAGKSMKKQNLL